MSIFENLVNSLAQFSCKLIYLFIQSPIEYVNLIRPVCFAELNSHVFLKQKISKYNNDNLTNFFLPFFSSFLGHQNVLIEMPNMKVLVTQAAVMFSNTMILHMMIHIQIILGLEETRRKMCMGSQGYLLQHYPLHLVQIIKFVEVLVVELVPLAQLLPVVQRIQDAMQKKETG